MCLFLFVLSAQDVGKEWQLESEDRFDRVQKYVDNIQPETKSVITVSSDSGLGTHGAPSVLEFEDTSGQYFFSTL